MKTRNVFGTIFLVTGLGIFYALAATSIATELDDVLHGPPLTEPVRKFTREKLPKVDKLISAVLPWKQVGDLPHIKGVSANIAGGTVQSTDENPFQQFSVVKLLGWAFVWSAIMQIGAAYLKHTKTRVEE